MIEKLTEKFNTLKDIKSDVKKSKMLYINKMSFKTKAHFNFYLL
ncbi:MULTISPECIES: hypothetical protein [Clostridium]